MWHLSLTCSRCWRRHNNLLRLRRYLFTNLLVWFFAHALLFLLLVIFILAFIHKVICILCTRSKVFIVNFNIIAYLKNSTAHSNTVSGRRGVYLFLLRHRRGWLIIRSSYIWERVSHYRIRGACVMTLVALAITRIIIALVTGAVWTIYDIRENADELDVVVYEL